MDHDMDGRNILPVGWIDNGESSSPKVLEDAGVIFGDLVPDDPLFQFVEVPIGWKFIPGDHPMWTRLVDQNGRERAAIWYRDTPDRDAHYEANTRYFVSLNWDHYETEGVIVGQVMDGDEIIYHTDPFEKRFYGENTPFDARDAAEEWLNANFPNWEDSGAYWDKPATP